MLYALGVGAGHDNDAKDLRFIFEDGLQVLPTMAVVLGHPGFWQKDPRYALDWRRILHAEQSVTFHSLLPVEGHVRGELVIERIIDKGAAKGALLYAKRRLFDGDNDRLLATVKQVSFLKGNGGQGGSSNAAAEPPLPVPDRAPDAIEHLVTRPEQALLYRLSGDDNPLHADPKAAAAVGLPRPILHGLATYGFAGRAILRALCGNDPQRLRQLDCRFTAPVFPGDGLEVAIWHDGPDRAAFQVRVAARQVVVLDYGYAEILTR